MNATQYYIGKNKTTRRNTATQIAPTVGRVRQWSSKTENRKRNTERPTEIRTKINDTNGFLRLKFLPKLEETQIAENCRKTAKTERDFYKSLSNFAEHYHIEPIQTRDFGFPYNIKLAMRDLENQLTRVNEDWNQFRLMQDDGKTFFVKKECFRTMPFYYIPVVPLYKMLQNPKHKKNAQLLVSVCSYLYHIADVPYYRQQDSYLYWIYEMHQEWIEQGDEAEDDLQEFNREFKISKSIGDKIEQKLFSRKNLEIFKQRLDSFKSRDIFDHECWRIAYNAFSLYTKYPRATVFRNKPNYEQNPYADDYENEAIGMEKYISFVANTKGWLYQSIEESINCEFNEYGSIEEPTIYTPINKNEIAEADFDFEKQIFPLLDDLTTLLHNYKTTGK